VITLPPLALPVSLAVGIVTTNEREGLDGVGDDDAAKLAVE